MFKKKKLSQNIPQVTMHKISFDVTFLNFQEYQIIFQTVIRNDNTVNNNKEGER